MIVAHVREFRLKSELLALEEGKTIRYLGTDRQVSDRILLVLKVVPEAGLVDTAKAIQKRYLEIVICSSHHADQSWTDYCLNSHGEGLCRNVSSNLLLYQRGHEQVRLHVCLRWHWWRQTSGNLNF